MRNWLDSVDGVVAHGTKEWSEYPMDGGMRWVLFKLPERLQRPTNGSIAFSSERAVPEEYEYCHSLVDWLRHRINIDREPCRGAGTYFHNAAFIKVVGRRCLAKIMYGWDV